MAPDCHSPDYGILHPKLQKANPSMGLSTLSSFAKLPSSWKVWMMHIVFGLEMAALACIIIALARPQTYNHLRTSRIEGTDIVFRVGHIRFQ